MAGEPAETLIGFSGLGLGVVLLYCVVKNKKPFGKDGLITQILQTGKWPDMTTVPTLFVSSTGTGAGATLGQSAGRAALQGFIIASAQRITDPQLQKDVIDYVNNGVGDPASISSRLRAAGFSDIANLIDQWANLASGSGGTSGTSPTTPGGSVPSPGATPTPTPSATSSGGRIKSV